MFSLGFWLRSVFVFLCPVTPLNLFFSFVNPWNVTTRTVYVSGVNDEMCSVLDWCWLIFFSIIRLQFSAFSLCVWVCVLYLFFCLSYRLLAYVIYRSLGPGHFCININFLLLFKVNASLKMFLFFENSIIVFRSCSPSYPTPQISSLHPYASAFFSSFCIFIMSSLYLWVGFALSCGPPTTVHINRLLLSQ